jgi:hypothetical protein
MVIIVIRRTRRKEEGKFLEVMKRNICICKDTSYIIKIHAEIMTIIIIIIIIVVK